MNKTKLLITIMMIIGFCFTSCEKTELPLDESDLKVAPASSYSVKLAGNAFITAGGGSEQITTQGLQYWSSSSSIISTYFRLSLTGTLTIKVKAKSSGTSVVAVRVNGTQIGSITINKKSLTTFTVNTINMSNTGYVKVDLQGVSKTSTYFADVSDIIISGTATTSGVDFANDSRNFYWSRRGPSVHLGFNIPTGKNAEWFYNEITVPTGGYDTPGCFYMANGSSQGYFGIQVVSLTERWVLFSIWDGNAGKTTLVSKGNGVIDNTFGGEGTGGQSYLVYNWQAGNTYKFLKRGIPDGYGNTLYSAWFYAPETSTWKYIATWKCPNGGTYLKDLYSFNENFEVEKGYYPRKAFYSNQWIKATDGVWYELNNANFTGDATASNRQRMDFAGGVENGIFYLKNCGFFSTYVNLNQNFVRTATGIPPSVNLSTLP
jgi:hypothetical protein